MAALHDSGSKDPAVKRVGRGGGGDPKQKRARSLGTDTGGGGGSSTPAIAPASKSRGQPGISAASLVDVTVEDRDALECVVCYLPLKPPIFQCDVGHAVCSRCRDKLQATGWCAVCRVVTSSCRRCHAMERLVESIRVPCPYAAHGCALRPFYYDQESHRSLCAYAPCHCPGEECSFAGSMSALLDHCSTTHKWPCITTVKPDDNDEFNICLHDGFNFLLADCSTGNKNQGSTASIQCLLLLTVARQPYARIISVHCIDPHAAMASGDQGPTSKEMQCRLSYSVMYKEGLLFLHHSLVKDYRSLDKDARSVSGKDYYEDQESKIRVVRTDLSNGLPKPDIASSFVVPHSGIEVIDKDGIEIKVRIFIQG